MTRTEVETATRSLVEEALADRATEMARLGLEASPKIIPRKSDSSELHIAFHRDGALFTFVEDFIVREGEPVTPMDELRVWVRDSIDDVLKEAEAEQ